MKRLFAFLFGLSLVTAKAQVAAPTGTTNTLDAYWNLTTVPGSGQANLVLSNTTIPGPNSPLNEAIIRQDGSSNSALLSVLLGSQNRLEANQNSSGNTINTTLSGSNNSILLNQTGGGNAVSLGLAGDGNRYSFTQDGGDRIQISGIQQSNTRLELTQGSGNNSFTADSSPLLISGTGIPNLRIEQTGGASITIQPGQLIGGIKP